MLNQLIKEIAFDGKFSESDKKTFAIFENGWTVEECIYCFENGIEQPFSKTQIARLKRAVDFRDFKNFKEKSVSGDLEVARRCKDLKHLNFEVLRVLCLNAKNEPEFHLDYKGDQLGVNVEVNTILRDILIRGTKRFILCHNHPSGYTEPSAEDIRFTQAIAKSCEFCSLTILDHVIVAGDKHYSFRRNGYIC